MNLIVSQRDPRKAASDLLIVVVPTQANKFTGPAALLDKAMGGQLSDLMVEEKFEGKQGQWAELRTMGKLGATRVALLGLGQPGATPEIVREIGARLLGHARRAKAKKVTVVFAGGYKGKLADVGQAFVEGAVLGDYRFLKYKSEQLKEYVEGAVERVELYAASQKEVAALEAGFKLGHTYSTSTILARGLVNEPSSEVSPAHLGEVAAALAKAHPDCLKLKLIDQAGIEKLKMGGLLAVAKGSDHPPVLIHLIYKPKRKATRRLVVVGKGLTFDSGGLSLKPAKSMEDMKIDMAGCAAMLGIMSALPALAPDVEVHGIAGVCENMPSGRAMRPGDIVTPRSGKTIEVLNTDAEGRVTLADTLFYGSELKPDYMVDLATLTGACMVALGEEVAGLMSNDEKLSAMLMNAANDAGENLWPLPLVKLYQKTIKSKVADLKNISGSGYGGAITAGLFLQEYVGKTKWAHLDIAGPAYAERESVPHQPLGATGFGVRTVLNLIKSL
jgi:leucyl aminopeptidase